MKKLILIMLLIPSLTYGQADAPPPVRNALVRDAYSLPELVLNVPVEVPFSRFAQFSIEPIEISPDAPFTIQSVSVDWNVVERSDNPNPLENDIQIDRLDATRAFIPTGNVSTTIWVSATATLELKLKDGTTVLRKIKRGQNVQIGPKNPGPEPVVDPVNPRPGPGPAPPPIPPAPVIDPTFPNGKFQLSAWSYATLKEKAPRNAATRTQALALAAGLRQIGQMTRNNPAATRAEVINNAAEANRNNLGTDLPAWIPIFLEPLRLKLNSMNVVLLTPIDQAVAFEEIAVGLEGWANSFRVGTSTVGSFRVGGSNGR